MRKILVIAAVVLGAACKKDTPPPPEPPVGPGREARPSEIVPSKKGAPLDPTKLIPGRDPRPVHPSVARALGRFRQVPPVRVGTGTLSAKVGEERLEAPAHLFRRGFLYFLSAD